MEEGGLGIRDLSIFGDALFLKNAWDLMRQGDKFWVQICQAKYYPKIGFWKATNTNGASALWREVVKVRHHLKSNVRWELNNGKHVHAISQPWFTNWEVHQDFNPSDTVKKVSHLLNPVTGLWNVDELQRLFGRDKATTIQTQIKPPDPTSDTPDRLIWIESKTGRYSVKEGYEELYSSTQHRVPGNIGVQWAMINKWKFVAPKVKVFLWRMLSKALPLAQNLHRRITTISPLCQRCGQENEYESHCFFFCPGSRRVWFQGRLGLRTHDQSLDIIQAFTQTISLLDEDGIKLYSYTLWELWKGRNEVIMQHKQFDPIKILRAVDSWMRGGVLETQVNKTQQQELKVPGYMIQRKNWQLLVDASWQQSGKAGTAYILYEDGVVSYWSCNPCEAHDPFHAEALAMLDGFKLVLQRFGENQNKMVDIFSDCQILVAAVTEMNTDNLPCWQALPVVQELISLYKSCAKSIQVTYVRRDAVKPSHMLANHARRKTHAKVGNEMDCTLLLELGIRLEIDKNYFEIT
ncbi:Ribonuclease H-like superfamily protein [Rhynchospora pubera]|nr:Ribonuclease H-like superfamily protein [Rhynchospora pubera]